jgi:hypothetical protein
MSDIWEDSITNKVYYDSIATGLNPIESCKVGTIKNLVGLNKLKIGTKIDGYFLSVDDRILVKDQNNANENGIYIVTDVDSHSVTLICSPETLEIKDGYFTFIENGHYNLNTGWVCTEDGSWVTFSTPNNEEYKYNKIKHRIRKLKTILYSERVRKLKNI